MPRQPRNAPWPCNTCPDEDQCESCVCEVLAEADASNALDDHRGVNGDSQPCPADDAELVARMGGYEQLAEVRRACFILQRFLEQHNVELLRIRQAGAYRWWARANDDISIGAEWYKARALADALIAEVLGA